MKKLFILLAVAVMAAGCNQNPPTDGGTGTVTPVDNPTEPVDPADGMRISYVRNDSLAYTFTGSNFPIFTSSTTIQWDIIDPGLAEPYQVRKIQYESLNYIFHAPGKARITLSTLKTETGTGTELYVPDQSTSITVEVY